jgi:hypothetical protein
VSRAARCCISSARCRRPWLQPEVRWLIVRQNLFWAFVYNSLGIPVAAGLFHPIVSLIISPELAGLLMAVSSVTMTLNTLLLRGFKPSIRREDKPHRGAGGATTRLARLPRAESERRTRHGTRASRE